MLFGSVTDADLAKVRARTMAQRKAQYKQRMLHKNLVSPVLFGNYLQTLHHNQRITSYEQGHGKYLEYDPKEFFMDPSKVSGGLLKESRANKTRIIICVSHKGSKYCPYMNKCLTELAMQHPETKVGFVCNQSHVIRLSDDTNNTQFAKWDLEKVSADHLGESVFALMHRMFRYDRDGNMRLPYLYCIKDGEKVHHFEGLEKFNGTSIKTEYVYAHLANIGMVNVKDRE